MENKKKLIGAEAFGVKLIRVKTIEGISGRVLNPEKLEEANRVLKQIDWAEFRAKYRNK